MSAPLHLLRSERWRLDTRQRSLAVTCVDRYLHDLRVACDEDQGKPNGQPGTVGWELQAELRAVREALKDGAA